MNTIIPGIGLITVNQTEYTTAEVVQAYLSNLAILSNILGRTPDVGDLGDMVSAVNNLTNLLKNGVTSGTPPATYTSYLSGDAATKLGLVLQSLSAVGITSNLDVSQLTDDQKLQYANQWKSLADLGVTQILNNALTALGSDPTRSLQSMIELEYVKNGNDIIYAQLNNLEKALQSTQTILDTLQIIQSISNQIKAPAAGTLVYQTNGSVSQIVASYESAAGTVLTQLTPTPTPTSTAAYQLLAAKAKLSAQMVNIPQAVDPNSSGYTLAYFLQKVLKDISSHFVGVSNSNAAAMSSAVYSWILDNQNLKVGAVTSAGASAGAIQDNISQAIQSAQSLNDTQKAAVNNYMFIFQQFYQSASTVLQKITQIVEGMARKMSA